MSAIDQLISKVFRDTTAREVVDLATTLKNIANDLAMARITEDEVREFLIRNKRFLQYVLDSYAREKYDVNQFIEEVMDALVLASTLGVGTSLTLKYSLSRSRKKREEETRII